MGLKEIWKVKLKIESIKDAGNWSWRRAAYKTRVTWALCLLLSFGPKKEQGLAPLVGGRSEALVAQTRFWVLNQAPADTLHMAYFLAALPNQLFHLFVTWVAFYVPSAHQF